MSIEQTLANIEDRLSRIEQMLMAPTLNEALAKRRYSISEIAELTEARGIKAYACFTIRRAAADGRIPEATKLDDGKTWCIPREAVLRILEEGLPPERRTRNGRA